jgi:hypothetical protein
MPIVDKNIRTTTIGTAITNGLDYLFTPPATGNSSIRTNIGADYCTVAISISRTFFGSARGRPGHCVIMLWNSANATVQSVHFGTEGMKTSVLSSKKGTTGSDIWFYTCAIDNAQYLRMWAEMASIRNSNASYDMVLPTLRGNSFNCVTTVDRVLRVGLNKYMAVSSNVASPYLYSQTFSRFFWYVNAEYGAIFTGEN